MVPPRPPKLLPKVHRPRAPEPLMMDSTAATDQQQQEQPLPLPPRASTHHSSPSTTTTSSSTPHHQLLQQQQQPPKIPLRPTIVSQPLRQSPSSTTTSSTSTSVTPLLHISRSATPTSNNPAQVAPPTTALLVPLQQQSITFARRRLSPHQSSTPNTPSSPQQSGGGIFPGSPLLSSPRTGAGSNASSPFGGTIGGSGSTSPIISTLTRNLTNLSNNIIHNLSINQLTTGEPPNSVTLAVPRPENERLTNEYVDTPFVLRTNSNINTTSNINSNNVGQQQFIQNQHHHLVPSSQSGSGGLSHNVNSSPVTPQLPSRTGSRSGGQTADSISQISPSTRLLGTTESSIIAQPVKLLGSTVDAIHRIDPAVITKQPTFKKDVTDLHSIDKLDGAELSANLIDGGRILGSSTGHAIAVGSLGGGNGGSQIVGDGPASITCPRCERCRCANCQKPRALPSRWVCGKTLFCSAETMTDYLTCLCCVKALFYHCSNNPEIDNENGNSISCADDPCSCLPHKRAARWGFLSAISLLLPCLICYWPMKGATALCGKCYASYSREGCRCNNKKSRQIEQLQFAQHLQQIQQPATNNSQSQGGGHHHHLPNGKKIFPMTMTSSKQHQMTSLTNKSCHKNQTSNSSSKQIDCDSNRLGGGKQEVENKSRLQGGGGGGKSGDNNSSFCGEEEDDCGGRKMRCNNNKTRGCVVNSSGDNGGLCCDEDSSRHGQSEEMVENRCGNLIRTLRITSNNSSTSSTLSLLRSHSNNAADPNNHQQNLLDISPDY